MLQNLNDSLWTTVMQQTPLKFTRTAWTAYWYSDGDPIISRVDWLLPTVVHVRYSNSGSIFHAMATPKCNVAIYFVVFQKCIKYKLTYFRGTNYCDSVFMLTVLITKTNDIIHLPWSRRHTKCSSVLPSSLHLPQILSMKLLVSWIGSTKFSA